MRRASCCKAAGERAACVAAQGTDAAVVVPVRVDSEHGVAFETSFQDGVRHETLRSMCQLANACAMPLEVRCGGRCMRLQSHCRSVSVACRWVLSPSVRSIVRPAAPAGAAAVSAQGNSNQRSLRVSGILNHLIHLLDFCVLCHYDQHFIS